MTPLILFAIFFTCGLVINSYLLFLFLSPSKLLAWVSSLLSLCPLTRSKTKLDPKTSKKESKDKAVSTATANELHLETVFSTFDRDGDGFVTSAELEESLKRLGLSTTSAEVTRMMEKVDSNGDGLIDLEEFRELYELFSSGRQEGEEEGDEMHLKEAFDVFDDNGDGLITAEELGLVLRSLGLKQGGLVEDCHEMIRKVDKDGDGKVNFEEFKKMMVLKGGKVF
ncbi:calmodulin-like protein 6 [Typha angustifolia]|uniref:calmodulin-like protein 6 n=1 Tax=Typha angustifolia TaxID=59011 RepID=UPI003C2B5176